MPIPRLPRDQLWYEKVQRAYDGAGAGEQLNEEALWKLTAALLELRDNYLEPLLKTNELPSPRGVPRNPVDQT